MQPSRRSAVSPFIAMDVMAAANAAEAALRRGRIGYTEALGLRDLRERVARHYADRYGVTVPAERVAVTSGSSGGFNLAFLALFDVGDRVGLPTPGYPAYRNILQALGLKVVEIPTTVENRWQVTPAMLEAVQAEGPLKGLIVASPANPSGTMMERQGIADLMRACRSMGISLIMDEIYHGLVYEGEETTALEFGDDVVVINSFSKYYCMTGWRIGWMVLPEALVRPIERIAQNLFISPSEISQRAALGAFEAIEELEAVKAGYAANRALLLERLPAIGFDQYLPVDGAFYVYASVRRFSNDSLDFARRMLNEAGVAATPGPDFDTDRGHGYIRFSFAGTNQAMQAACDRLEGWLGR